MFTGPRQELDDETEILFRQIHPSWVHGQRITSQAFRPTKKDEGRLSVDRSAKTTCADSYSNHLALGLRTIAVYGVTVGEVIASNCAVMDDPQPDKGAHAFVEFDGLSKSQTDAVAGRLKDFAVARKQLHP